MTADQHPTDRSTIAQRAIDGNTLAEIAALHDAGPAMYRALKAISANEWIMLDVFSQATRQLVREAIRQAEAR